MTMKRNKRFWTGILLCMLLLLPGCGRGVQEEQETEVSSQKEQEDKILIGMSFDSFVIERWIRDRDAFVATAKELGAEVNVQNANGDVQEQISQIEYLVKKDVDVLVAVAADCEAIAPAMRNAKAKGIKTISYDRLILQGQSDLYVSFDNEAVGTLMAQALKETIPEGGEIFMIQGPEEDNNVKLVRKGFQEEIKNSGLEVVYKANCEGWLAENAVGYVNEALRMYPDVKGIMCGNDDIASQVIHVLAENQMAGQVKVVGQDGDLAACQRIVEGTQTMTAFKSVEHLAQVAAEHAVAMVQGEDQEEITATMNDGSGEIPFCMLMPVAVTKKNMEEIIVDGGFHSKEDVYLNVVWTEAKEVNKTLEICTNHE